MQPDNQDQRPSQERADELAQYEMPFIERRRAWIDALNQGQAVDPAIASEIEDTLLRRLNEALSSPGHPWLASSANAFSSNDLHEFLAIRAESWSKLAQAIREQNPQLAAAHDELWVRSEILLIASQTDQHRRDQIGAGAGMEIAAFHRKLAGMTPRAWCTPAIEIVCVVLFAAMVASGVSATNPAAADLIPWGANFGPQTMHGQWWRLGTCTLLHFGIPHLVFNLLVLYSIGCLIERLLGHVGLLIVGLVTGVAGSVASLFWNPTVVSVGISGVVFGLFGVLLGFLFRGRGTIPVAVFRELRNSGLSFVGYNLVFSIMSKGIDHGAHLGGLSAGLLLGIIAGRPLDAWYMATRGTRNVAMACAGVIGIGAAIAALPAAPRDMIAETTTLGKDEELLLKSYSQMAELAQKQQLDDAGLARRIEQEIMPGWHKLREGWKSIKTIPGTRGDLIDGIDRCLLLRQESWEALLRAIKEQDASMIQRHQDKWVAADSCAKELNSKNRGR